MVTRPDLCASARRRVALYAHDTQRLCHTRRNIVIATSLVAAAPDTDVLLRTARARRDIDLGGSTVVPRLADRLCRLGRTAEEVPPDVAV